MKKQTPLVIVVVAATLLSAASTAFAQSGNTPAMPYGNNMMNQQEWQQHRETMWGFRTQAERDAYRAQIHQQMRNRALERGIEMPLNPPAWGLKGMDPQGMNRGQGSGGQGSGGMGSGGMGSGGMGSGGGNQN